MTEEESYEQFWNTMTYGNEPVSVKLALLFAFIDAHPKVEGDWV